MSADQGDCAGLWGPVGDRTALFRFQESGFSIGGYPTPGAGSVGSPDPDDDAGDVLVRACWPPRRPLQPYAPGKKAQAQPDPNPWRVKKVGRSLLSWFQRGLRLLQRRLQTDQPVPTFSGGVM